MHPLYESLMKTWCDALVAHQVTEMPGTGIHGGIMCPACSRIHGRCGDAVYPLMRMAGPTYRWAIERRIYRWYRVLGRIERRMDSSGDSADLRRIEKELDDINEHIRHMYVPSRYASNLFTLSMHHKLLEDRLRSLQSKADNDVNKAPGQTGSKE